MLIDSGAAVSVIRSGVLEDRSRNLVMVTSRTAIGDNGLPLNVRSICPITFRGRQLAPIAVFDVATLLKKKARGVLGLRGVTAQGVLWQHTRVLS